MMDADKKLTVAYVPFKTFLAAIEGFERHMPNQIDSTVWPTYSGAIKSQLLGAFRFLGLIDEKGHATASLKALVEDRGGRKVNLRKVLEASYKPILALGLQKATPKQFQEAMNQYGMTGATQGKVASFFIKAARYAELPMSPLLLRKSRTSGPRRRRTYDNQAEEELVLPSGNADSTQGTSKTIELKSGGKLTLTLSVNVFDLNANDRDFVFGMIDKLQGYKTQKEKGATA